MKTVVIFGGSGFVGRHIIARIAKNGHKIIVPHQQQVNEANLRLLGVTGQIIPIRFKSINGQKIQTLIKHADVIFNLKTQWDENRNSYKEGILKFNTDLINMIKSITQPPQFIYFSGIGTDEKNHSKRSKVTHKSEKYALSNLKNAVIIRPGIIIGGGDKFTKGLLPFFKISFFIPLFGGGLSKFQPVFINDVSMAINKIIESNLSGSHLFELVGDEVFTYKEFYRLIANCIGKTRVLVPIPFFIAKIGVSILEKTPFSPLNIEQLNLFENDNICSNSKKKLIDLGINPQNVSEVIKKIVKKNI